MKVVLIALSLAWAVILAAEASEITHTMENAVEIFDSSKTDTDLIQVKPLKRTFDFHSIDISVELASVLEESVELETLKASAGSGIKNQVKQSTEPPRGANSTPKMESTVSVRTERSPVVSTTQTTTSTEAHPTLRPSQNRFIKPKRSVEASTNRKTTVQFFAAQEGSGGIFPTSNLFTDPEGSGSGDVSTPTQNSGVTYTTTQTPTQNSGVTYTTMQTPTQNSGVTYTTTQTNPPQPTNTPVQCQNGGTPGENACNCPPAFSGSLCQFITDKIEIGPTTNASIKVTVKIINMNYTDQFNDHSSEKYKTFENHFKLVMKETYSNLGGYQDVEILSLRSGSIIVVFNVIVKINTVDVNVTEEYYSTFQEIKNELENLKTTESCLGGKMSEPLCIDRNTTLVTEPALEDLCKQRLPDGFKDFFTVKETGSGLVCLSDCNGDSKRYTNCYDGSCQIVPYTGSKCFCRNTNDYIYTSSNCQGKVLKAGVYGGVGAAIGVLVLAVLVLVFIQIKKRREQKRDVLTSRLNNQYEDNEWNVESVNINYIEHNDQDDTSEGSGSRKFQPELQNVDTSLKVQIKRPSVSVST